MNYPNNFWGWVSFLLVPKFPKWLVALVHRLVARIPIHRSRKWFVACIAVVICFPSMAFAADSLLEEWFSEIYNFVLDSWLGDLAKDLAKEALDGINSSLIDDTDISSLPYVSEALRATQAIAGGMVALVCGFEILSRMGLRSFSSDERSSAEIYRGVIVSIFLIMFLPYLLESVIIPINNALLAKVKQIGNNEGINALTDILLFSLPQGATAMTLLFLVFAVICLILAIVSAIRYIELSIVFIISPLVALSAMRNYEAIGIWARETTAIVFTQVVHVFLLNLLFAYVDDGVTFWGILKSIGVIVVMLRGPQVLRQFLYATGTGNTIVNAAGGGGRMVAMKLMAQSLKP